jgi:hypothetical protein
VPTGGTFFVPEDAEYRQVRVFDGREAISQIAFAVRPATGIDRQVPPIGTFFRSRGSREHRQAPVPGRLETVRWIEWPGQSAIGVDYPD